MNLSPEKLNRLFDLCGMLREEQITPEEFAELNSLLENDPAAQELYLNYVYLCTDLCRLQAAIEHASVSEAADMDSMSPEPDLEMLRAMGEYEKQADALELPSQQELPPMRVRLADVDYVPHKVSKLSIFTLLTSLAALLLLVAYVSVNPYRTFEVATLTDALDAQWSSPMPLKPGTRLSASRDGIHLQKGILKFQTDEGVAVVLEAPAEFRFTGPSEIMLQYGRLFATVSNIPNGFSVQTSNARVIDLGTEFGVYADTRGRLELHVYKGKTALIADTGSSRQILDVVEGQARQFDNVSNEIRPITIDQGLFARDIESGSGLIWRNDRYIDLADIVGGGNGTGSGSRDRAIRWDGQKLLAGSESPALTRLSQKYVPVTFSPFVDGIFIPYSKGTEPLTLNSDTASLSLNEFIRQDTNGLVTLMLLFEMDDSNACYWFNTKEGAANRRQMPSLTFPHAQDGPLTVTTADLNGADAFVANDLLTSPRSRAGKEGTLCCRYLQHQRVRMIYLRFDISQLKGDLSNAILSLYLSNGNRSRELGVYGLADGPADFWEEATISFNTAPAMQTAPLGNYSLDESACRRLGTFRVVDNRISTDPIAVTADGRYRWSPPQTMDRAAYAISNGPTCVAPQAGGQTLNLRLAGALCGTPENPSILMHANAAITFDLQAIRQAHGQAALKSFTADCGLSPAEGASEIQEENLIPTASFYVLLDGKEVFSAIDLSPQEAPQLIDISLIDGGRYLTLVTTQGTDNSIENDLCLFVKPVIHFE